MSMTYAGQSRGSRSARSPASGVLAGEIHQGRAHAAADVALVAELERREDRTHVALDCPLGDHEPLGNRRVAPAFGDEAEDLELSRGQATKPLTLPLSIAGEQLLDDSGIDDRAADRDLAHGPVQVAGMADSLLEQICAPPRAVLEERRRIHRVGVLAQDDHADIGVRRAKLGGEADALIGLRRRHANVGDDDVRPELADGGSKRIEVLVGAEKIDIGQRLERARYPLTREIAVLTEYDADAQEFSKERTSVAKRHQSWFPSVCGGRYRLDLLRRRRRAWIPYLTLSVHESRLPLSAASRRAGTASRTPSPNSSPSTRFPRPRSSRASA